MKKVQYMLPAMIKTFVLFVVTAIAEIVGCYLPYLWLKKGGSVWLLIPAGVSLALFAWLLSLHPTAAGRVYAAYGGVYVFVAIMWLWLVRLLYCSAWPSLCSGPVILHRYIIQAFGQNN